jgi:hypothetical protein
VDFKKEKVMNETIKELFKSAGGSVVIEDVTQDEWTFTENLDVEKFANLIIKECAEVAGCNGHVSGFMLGDLIKQHFEIK